MRSYSVGRAPGRAFTGKQAFLIALVALAVLIPYTSPGGVFSQHANPLILRVDEGTVIYDSLRVAQGQVPYRDFFEFPGPMTFYFYGAIFRFIAPTLEAARWGTITLMALSAALVAIVASRLGGRIAGVGAALLQTCAFVPSYPFAYTHWVAAVPGLAALVLLGAEKPKKNTDIIGGALCALSLLTIQSVGLPLWAAAVGTVWIRGAARRDLHEALRRPAYVLLGGSLVLGVVCLYFAAVGGLKQFLYCTWTWPLNRYRLGQEGGMQYGFAFDAGVFEHSALAEPLKRAAIATLKFILTAPFGAAVSAFFVSIWSLWAIVRRRPEHTWRVVLGGMCFAAVFPPLVGRTRGDITHLAFVGAFGVLGTCVLLHFFRRRLFAMRVGATSFLLAGLISAYAYGAKLHRVQPRIHYATFAEEFDREYMQNGFLQLMRRNLEPHMDPHEPVVVGLVGGYYHFFHRPSPLRVTRLPNTFADDYYTDVQLRDMVDTILKKRPKVIAVWTDYQLYVISSRAPQFRSVYHRYTSNLWVLKTWAIENDLLKPK